MTHVYRYYESQFYLPVTKHEPNLPLLHSHRTSSPIDIGLLASRLTATHGGGQAELICVAG